MAHFVALDENNVVTAINVIADSDCLDGEGNESEAVGIAFCEALFAEEGDYPHVAWKQTSYTNRIRKQYARVGGRYDPVRDEFIDLQPHDSWTLNATNDWTPPNVRPDDIFENRGGEMILTTWYAWDELAYLKNNEHGWEPHEE
jgi:hypothetical protein